MAELQLFSGNANLGLAQKIATTLNTQLGSARVQRFKDSECDIEITDNVRHKDIYIIQSTYTPVNENLMELCLIADALHRSAAANITAVIPYFGYARQDRRIRSAKVPISARVVADMLENVGIKRIITVELHSDQVQGFFSIPVDNVFGTEIFIDDINKQKLDNLAIVSPDVGGMVRARAFAKRLNDPNLAVIEKRRNKDNEGIALTVIGDVQNRNCIIIDDMIDTGSTLVTAAAALRAAGAKKIIAYITHPVLSGDAVAAIEQSNLDTIVVTDSIPLSDSAKKSSKIRQISIAPLLSGAIVERNI